MIIIALILLTLIIYHHIGYPMLLKIAAHIHSARNAKGSNHNQTVPSYKGQVILPSIHIIVPAFNEERIIQQKIDSIGWLDYPDNRLTITVYCDGCNDNTVKKAILAQGAFYNRDLDIRIVNIKKNGGKVSVINRALAECKEDIIVFSDSSAILDQDVLWRSAQHFMNDSSIAVVTGDYSLISTDWSDRDHEDKSDENSSAETNYWKYQNKVRELESQLGSVIGVPGAYYAIRRECCKKLELDTINDDFILPMRAVSQGHKAIFDKNIHIFETEPTPLAVDAQRRRRISQGNAQQVIRLTSLLTPSLDLNRVRIQWMFLSGKGLRVIMPYLLITLLFISAVLSTESVFFTLLLLAQLSAYSLAAIKHQTKNQAESKGKNMGKNKSKKESILCRLLNSKIILLNSYICQGHLMGLIGSIDYLNNLVKQKLLGKEKTVAWKKINIEMNK